MAIIRKVTVLIISDPNRPLCGNLTLDVLSKLSSIIRKVTVGENVTVPPCGVPQLWDSARYVIFQNPSGNYM